MRVIYKASTVRADVDKAIYEAKRDGRVIDYIEMDQGDLMELVHEIDGKINNLVDRVVIYNGTKIQPYGKYK